MKKRVKQIATILCLCVSTSNCFALSDDFYVTGADLEFMFESNSNYALEELEDELRKFVFYRKLEDLLLVLDDEYPGISH